jgi:hypothetical protein
LLADTDATQLLLYTGNSTVPNKIQSSILMTVNKVLEDAGLAGDPPVKPQSVRNGAARRAYNDGGIEAAAGLLGIRDLNGVAREIGVRPHLPQRQR